MLSMSVTKDKLNKLVDSGIRFNIVDTYFLQSSCKYKYFKMFNVIIQDTPLSLKNSKTHNSHYRVLGTFSRKGNDIKIIKSLIGSKMNTIISELGTNMRCGSVGLSCVEGDGKYTLIYEEGRTKLKPLVLCGNCFKSKISDANDVYKDVNSNKYNSLANYIDVEYFLAHLIQTCERRGWEYDKDAFEGSSSCYAWNRSILDTEISDSYIQKAKEYIDIFKNHEDSSEFMKSIKILLSKEKICYNDVKQIGFVYKKVEDILESQNQIFVGTIGDNYSGICKFISVKDITTRYGDCRLYRFKQGDNATIVHLGKSFFDLKKGESYEIAGKISKHDIYGDKKQTSISKLSIIRRVE